MHTSPAVIARVYFDGPDGTPIPLAGRQDGQILFVEVPSGQICKARLIPRPGTSVEGCRVLLGNHKGENTDLDLDSLFSQPILLGSRQGPHAQWITIEPWYKDWLEETVQQRRSLPRHQHLEIRLIESLDLI